MWILGLKGLIAIFRPSQQMDKIIFKINLGINSNNDYYCSASNSSIGHFQCIDR